MENELYESLYEIYAKYFMRDFALRTFTNLQGTYPGILEYVTKFIEHKTGEFFSPNEIVTSDDETHTYNRFIGECARYAITHNVPDPESYATWEMIRKLPSMHHDEIETMAYELAAYYATLSRDTVNGFIRRDAKTITDAIATAVASAIVLKDSGGVLNTFHWGAVADTQILNNAMIRVNNLSPIFSNQTTKPVTYHATLCFGYARQLALYAPLETDQYDQISPISQNLASQFEGQLLADYKHEDGDHLISLILTESSTLVEFVNTLTDKVSSPQLLPGKVMRLTAVLRSVIAMRDLHRSFGEDSFVPDFLNDRFEKLIDVLSFLVVGFGVLRETVFEELVILDVSKSDETDLVSITINGDLTRAVQQSGITDGDLILLGQGILDMGYGEISQPGWDISWLRERRDDVVKTVLARQSNLEELRNEQHIQVVKNIVLNKIFPVVMTYTQATTGAEVPPSIRRDVTDLAEGISEGTISSLEDAIFLVLVGATRQESIIDFVDKLMTYASSEQEDSRNHALALATVESVIEETAESVIA